MSDSDPTGQATGMSADYAAPDPHVAMASKPNAPPPPHLPHGSMWPIVMGLAISLVGLALITFGRAFRHGNDLSLGLGLSVVALLTLVIALVGWVREDIGWWKTNTGTGAGIARAGTLLFISSEIFIFGALFSSYFTFQRLADHWPDLTIHGGHFPLPLGTTAIFTLFLFSSSYTAHQAEKRLFAGNRQGFMKWWLATIVLGAIFLAGQVLEYTNLIKEGHTLGSSQFMTGFYMLTGTHGLHVLGGLIALILVYIRAKKGNFDEHRHDFPAAVSIYWHFVDLVWVFVFSVLYLVPVYILGAA